MTELIFLKYPDLFEISATVTAIDTDTKGMYIVFDHSLFYPQGGGQPADQGNISVNGIAYDVCDVRNIEGEVRHYVNAQSRRIQPGDTVEIRVDKSKRLLHSKYHTAGHLIAAVANNIAPELTAIKGHQFPGEAYIEFDGIVDDTDKLLQQLSAVMINSIKSDASVKTEALDSKQSKAIAENLPYALPENKSLRVCHIEGFTTVPCGGTHVKMLKEIGEIIIKKCKCKKEKTKIYYEVVGL